MIWHLMRIHIIIVLQTSTGVYMPHILSDTDLFGVMFFSVSSSPTYEDYYQSLRQLAPLLRADPWQSACTGFYLSGIERIVRLSYFAVDSHAPENAACAIYDATGLLQPRPNQAPCQAMVSQGYGGAELDFRRYLCTYTSVGLDLVEGSTLLHAQRLCATYRFQVFASAGAARPHFESSFKRMSESYRRLTASERDVFWTGFQAGQGWDHMFVNMLLAIDWSVPCDPCASSLSASELSAQLAHSGLSFDIPNGWTPDTVFR